MNAEISESTLISRINLKLTRDSEALRTERSKGSPSIGTYYVVGELLPAGHLKADIELLGRKLGVLLPGECLVRE